MCFQAGAESCYDHHLDSQENRQRLIENLNFSLTSIQTQSEKKTFSYEINANLHRTRELMKPHAQDDGEDDDNYC